MLPHLIVIVWLFLLVNPSVSPALKVDADPPPELEGHLQETCPTLSDSRHTRRLVSDGDGPKR